MQCPNCGKEAINVNGRYVCLDCGIELNPSGTPMAPAAASPTTPSVDNHPAPSLDSAMVAPEVAAPTPIVAEDRAPMPEPALDTSTLPIPEPTPSVEPEMPPIPEVTEPPLQTTAPTIAMPAEPPVAEPVKDYFMNEIELDKAPGEDNTATVAQDAPGGAVLPDFPATVTDPATSEATSPSPEIAPTETPAPVFGTPPNLSMDSEFASPDGHDSLADPATPVVPTPEPTPEISAVPESADFFQPSTMDIQPNAQPAPAPNPEPTSPPMVDAIPEPVVVTEAPTPPLTEPVPPIAPQMPDFNTPPAPIMPEAVDPLAQNTPVVDPLDAVSSVDGMGVPPVEVSQTPVNQAPTGNFPGTASLPSTESVFGGGAEAVAPVQTGGSFFAKNKKLIIIIGSVLAGLLVLGGLTLAIMAFSQNNSASEVGKNGKTDTLAISQNVAGQMDEALDVANSYTQSIDFSKATSKDAALALFFSKPVELKGAWAVSKEENISFEATQGTQNTKRIYVKAENGTYVFSPETNSYVKTEGMQLSPDSVFFPVDPRGGFFYLSKVDSFEVVGTENLGDKSVKKMKVIPKKKTIEDLLTATNPFLAKIVYEDVNIDALEIYAYVDEGNLVQKLTVSGVIQVTSDLFSGPVTLSSDGAYKYEPQTVAKP